MKRFIRDILFIAVALLYMVSTMGFGVHSCTADGTESLSVLYVESPCAHEHEGHNPDSGCPHHHGEDCSHTHQEDCCSTDVYVVTHDQNTTEDVQISVPEIELPYYACNAVDFLVSYSIVKRIEAGNGIAGDMGLEPGSRAELCSFRI